MVKSAFFQPMPRGRWRNVDGTLIFLSRVGTQFTFMETIKMHAGTQKSRWLVGLVGVAAVVCWTTTPLAWSQTATVAKDAAAEPAEDADKADAPSDNKRIDMDAWRKDYEAKQKSLVDGLRADPTWQASHGQTGSILATEGVPSGSLNNFAKLVRPTH